MDYTKSRVVGNFRGILGIHPIKAFTLLALVTPALNGVVFCDMALKGPALYVCLGEIEHEHLKNNANKGQR